MASERDQLKALVDKLPDDQLPALRRILEGLLRPAPGHPGSARQKDYPRRTPVGGIITPQ
jgi:hypothetical protein